MAAYLGAGLDDRLWCPGCGARTLQHVPAGPGRVEEETTLRRSAEPVQLGTVRLDSGPLVIARLATQTGAGPPPSGACAGLNAWLSSRKVLGASPALTWRDSV